MSASGPTPRAIAWRRRVANRVFLGLCVVALGLAVGALAAVLGYVVGQGASGLTPSFFINTPQPVGQVGGGMGNAIVGTLVLVLIAVILGLPVGIGAGVYLAEYGRGPFATATRFVADVLTGIPSITLGLFAYTLLVVPLRTFSALAGGFALALIMLPVVARTTEEMVRLVPGSLREAGDALGLPRWVVIVRVVLPSALGGIATGALLAVARAAGETAPLLFTAFGNQFWSAGLAQPIAALPLQVFADAISPYDDWRRQAWQGALVLVALVLALSLAARLLVRRYRPGG